MSQQDKNERDYKIEVLGFVTEPDVNEWVKNNPIPQDYEGSEWEYVYANMPVFKPYVMRFWRDYNITS